MPRQPYLLVATAQCYYRSLEMSNTEMEWMILHLGTTTLISALSDFDSMVHKFYFSFNWKIQLDQNVLLFNPAEKVDLDKFMHTYHRTGVY